MFVIKRSPDNPTLAPVRDRHWEASATFNMSPIRRGKTVYGLYRAVSAPDKLRTPEQESTIGITRSADGEHFEDRRQFITPEEEWEKFGCEDPRATFFEGRYYVFYTALSTYPFSAKGIKAAVAISDDLEEVRERHLVTPFNAKAMTLFPERVNGKATVIFSAHTDESLSRLCVAQADQIEEFWQEGFWEKWHAEIEKHGLQLRRDEFDHVEVGATPIKTERGWLVVYSHIQNYFSGSGRGVLFGIEAVLLDQADPTKIIGRTRGPMMVPEEPYEISGHVSNIVFPSGALVDGDLLTIYYGSADTTVSIARTSLHDLVSSIHFDTEKDFIFRRTKGNPVLLPKPENAWESKGVFNPAAIDLEGKVHILYRALSEDNTSTIGYASSSDAVTIDERLPDPIYVPREEFENKKINDANSGCEDPRLTKVGKTIYMCYTAFDGIGPPRVAVSSISEKDFLARRWKWTKPLLITPKGVDDKDTCILDEKVDGKYLILHRIGTDICADYLQTLDFKEESVKRCIRIFGPRPGMWDSGKVGISAPPVRVKGGWLLLYHASSDHHHTYRLGAALLDPKDPTIILARSADPIFAPEEVWEKEGIVPNVVFPCGLVVRDDLVYIYYGGADKVTGIASMKLSRIEEALYRMVDY